MPPKETVLDLARFIDKGVRVKLSGGREVTGTLKGFDQLLNLVLDGAVEHLRDFEDALKITEETRELGLLVCRGTSVMVVRRVGFDGGDREPVLGAGGDWSPNRPADSGIRRDDEPEGRSERREEAILAMR